MRFFRYSAALFFAAVFVCTQGAAEECFVITPDSVSPSSAEQWRIEGAEIRREAGKAVIALSSSMPAASEPWLYLPFDDGIEAQGAWQIEKKGSFSLAREGRFGTGSASFKAPAGGLVLRHSVSTGESIVGDMSLELWLKPLRAESGEIILLWKATRSNGLPQQLTFLVERNRISVGFINFFGGPDGKAYTVSLRGKSMLIPKSWSHHLIRYNSATGLLEYVMNGEVEDIRYVTSSGNESGTVYTPIPGAGGRLELAGNYTGLMDEFSVRPSFSARPVLKPYFAGGASVLSPVFDLGHAGSALRAIDVRQRCPAESAVHWEYRIADDFTGWTDSTPKWRPFVPGIDIGNESGSVRGRYIQIKMRLYPDAACEQSPAVSDISVRYEANRAPNAPSGVSAAAGNGSLTVRWKPLSESDIQGYVIYYGTSSGDYFGTQAAEGASPVWVQGRSSSSYTLSGLSNGTLYFVAVAAYDNSDPACIGGLSQEVCIRPARTSQ